MSGWRFAHDTPENMLCPRVVYVCPECGWWKATAFQCRHMVTAIEGAPAFRDHRAQRTTFTLYSDARRAKRDEAEPL